MPRKTKIRLAKTAATAALLILLYRRLDFAALRAAVAGLRVFPLALFFPLCAANMALSAARWRILLRADGISAPLGKLFTSYWIASFFNFFMPSNIGGDVFRIADITRRSGRALNTTVSVFADRLIGFAAMSLLGVVFPLAGWRMVSVGWRWAPALSALVFACFIAAAFAVRTRFFARAAPQTLPRMWRARAAAAAEAARGSFAAYARAPAALAKCFALSLVFQSGMIAAIWCVGESLGLGVPFFHYCVFVPMINLLESAPNTINGVGMRDMGYVAFFNASGVAAPETAAATASLVYMALTLLYASLGGVAFLLRRSRA